MVIQIFTQINEPKLPNEYSIWIPCLRVNSILSVCPIQTDSVFITHSNAVYYYEGTLRNKHIYCIGPITESQLRMDGYRVTRLADRARDVVLPDEPITWLHGDTYKRDFSLEPNVLAQQTYETTVDCAAVDRAIHSQAKFVYIYSPKVLKAFEERMSGIYLHLNCTDSCSPNSELWRSITRFYPTDNKYE